jgi:hypothetical protein
VVHWFIYQPKLVLVVVPDTRAAEVQFSEHRGFEIPLLFAASFQHDVAHRVRFSGLGCVIWLSNGHGVPLRIFVLPLRSTSNEVSKHNAADDGRGDEPGKVG